MNPPSMIYRYFSAERAIQLLKSEKLRLSSPSAFNDPFECIPSATISSILTQMKDGISRECAYSKIEEELIGINIIDELLVLPDLAARAYNHFRRKKAISTIKMYEKLIQRIRIGCFTETPDNLLMWSHYASSHTGIVIGFHSALDYWGNDFFKVEYENDRIDLPLFFSHEDEDPVALEPWQRSLLIRKSAHWNYEKEWRCIKYTHQCMHDDFGSYLTIPKQSIKEVILGMRISDEHRDEIKHLIAQEFPGTAIKKSIIHRERFELIIT